MTYGIFSLASGDVLEAYPSEERALDALARFFHSEPVTRESLALLIVDDDGRPHEAIEGERLAELIEHRETATA